MGTGQLSIDIIHGINESIEDNIEGNQYELVLLAGS